MVELKIGDEGLTGDMTWTRYQVVAVGVLNGSAIVRLYRHGGLTMVAEVREGMRTTNGVTLLPPKPKVLTLRRWLSVGGINETRIIQTKERCLPTDRPADIAYTPGGRIVSIVFVDDPAPPKSLDLRVGDVVRLRNGLMDVIRAIDGSNGDSVQPVVGDQFEWWPDGRYSLTREESERDIVAVVNRAEPTSQPCELCGEIWERLRKVSDAACWSDLREAVDDVVEILREAGWGGDNGCTK